MAMMHLPTKFGTDIFEHLYSPGIVAEIKKGKNTDKKRTNSNAT